MKQEIFRRELGIHKACVRKEELEAAKWEERPCSKCGMPTKVWKEYKGVVICDYCVRLEREQKEIEARKKAAEKRRRDEWQRTKSPEALLRKYSKPPVIKLVDVLE